jgi:NDP-sugar pyrophosphorylase family protein
MPLISRGRIPATSIHWGEGSIIPPKTQLHGFVSIGRDCRIESGVKLENCVVWDGTVVESGTRARNVVLGPGWSVHLRQ